MALLARLKPCPDTNLSGRLKPCPDTNPWRKSPGPLRSCAQPDRRYGQGVPRRIIEGAMATSVPAVELLLRALRHLGHGLIHALFHFIHGHVFCVGADGPFV